MAGGTSILVLNSEASVDRLLEEFYEGHERRLKGTQIDGSVSGDSIYNVIKFTLNKH